MNTYNLQAGSLVIAKRTTGVCDVGEQGVCYEQYTIDDRPGWSIIFKSGRHDGFSPDDIDLMLDVTGEVCEEVADYEFQDVLQLARDFRQGRFAAAFSLRDE